MFQHYTKLCSKGTYNVNLHTNSKFNYFSSIQHIRPNFFMTYFILTFMGCPKFTWRLTHNVDFWFMTHGNTLFVPGRWPVWKSAGKPATLKVFIIYRSNSTQLPRTLPSKSVPVHHLPFVLSFQDRQCGHFHHRHRNRHHRHPPRVRPL
jgi:hypothetical protein